MISENNKAKILHKLFKVKLVTLVEQLVPLLKRNFSYGFFSGIISRELLFRVSVRNRFWKTIQQRFFYQVLAKRLRSEGNNSVCSGGWAVCSAVLQKEIYQENCHCWRPASVIISCKLVKKMLHHGNVSTIFGIFICLVIKIIVV